MNIAPIYNRILKDADMLTNSPAKVNDGVSNKNAPSFKDIINCELEKLNNVQIEADKSVLDFMRGKTEDLHEVLIAGEEARLSLELAVQVRNKCIEAYKEINNMQF